MDMEWNPSIESDMNIYFEAYLGESVVFAAATRNEIALRIKAHESNPPQKMKMMLEQGYTWQIVEVTTMTTRRIVP